jgi:hypothetical protein
MPGDRAGGELYVRPDDRWEANDVAKLCPDVVEMLSKSLDTATRQFLQNQPIPISVVPDALGEGV